MNRFNFSELQKQSECQSEVEKVMSYIHESGEFSKTNAEEFLNSLHTHLLSSEATPKSKLMCLHMIKEITYLAEVRFFSVFSSNALLEELVSQAKTIDPKKGKKDKGDKLFEGEPEVGREYMQLLLEMIHFWGEKFARGKNSTPTKFKKNLVDLKNSGVVFPEDYSIFNPNEYRSKSKRQKESIGNSVSFNSGSVSKGIETQKLGKLSNDLRFTKDKISIYLGELEDAEDSETMENMIHTNHLYFEKEFNKYQLRGEEAQQEQEQTQNDYFSVLHFLEQESSFYSKYISIGDYSSYLSELKMLYENAFEGRNSNANSNFKPNESIKIKLNSNEEKGNFNGSANENWNSNGNRNSFGNDEPSSKGNEKKIDNKSRFANNNNVDTREILNNVYKKMEARSQSPVTGFAAIEKELERSKGLLRKESQSRSRSLRKVSPANIKHASSLSQPLVKPFVKTSGQLSHSKSSEVKIPDLPEKVYEGKQIPENRELKYLLQNVSPEQTIYRFKMSQFREKNPLFENSEIQIGFKSEAVYDEIPEFSYFLNLNIFIGNKTQTGITDFQLVYRGGEKFKLLAMPKKLDSIIPAGYQNKQDLIVVPLDLPFTSISMEMSYVFNGNKKKAKVLLPNSIIKFAQFFPLSSDKYTKMWRNTYKIKTNGFILARDINIDMLQKMIPVFDLSQYSRFTEKENTEDLILFCSVFLLKKYEFIFVINLRPNYEVVLQAGIIERMSDRENEEFCKEFLNNMKVMMANSG